MDRIFAKLLYEMEKGNPGVLVSIVASSGSAPRGLGSQMLVGTQGRIIGSVGGGAVELRCQELAARVLEEKKSLRQSFVLRKGGKEDIGMVCGGDVEVLLQYIPAGSEGWKHIACAVLDRINNQQQGFLVLPQAGGEPSLLDEKQTRLLGPGVMEGDCLLPLPIGCRAILFGGGHISAALAPLLKTVGFRVTVMDNRAEFANRQRFPDAEQVIVGDYCQIETYLKILPEDFAVVMTNGHSFDLEVQDQLLRKTTAYVGVVGSRHKKAAVNQKLLERGVTQEAIDRVHTPIGTDILAVTPEEIAVSIAGEMILVRAQRRKENGSYRHGCPMH